MAGFLVCLWILDTSRFLFSQYYLCLMKHLCHDIYAYSNKFCLFLKVIVAIFRICLWKFKIVSEKAYAISDCFLVKMLSSSIWESTIGLIISVYDILLPKIICDQSLLICCLFSCLFKINCYKIIKSNV